MRTASAIFGLLLLSFCHKALAGEAPDRLSECLLKSATQSDKDDLVRWDFVSFSLNPTVTSIIRIPDTTIASVNTKAINILVSLLTEKCRDEASASIKDHKGEYIVKSFELIDATSIQNLSSNTNVISNFSSVMEGVSKDDSFKRLVADALGSH